MNLFQKGLVLLSIPLVFEIGLIFTLLHQNSLIEQETRAISKIKSTVQVVYMVQGAYLEASSKIMRLQYTGDFHYYMEFEDVMKRIPSLVARLKSMGSEINFMQHPIVPRLLEIQAKVEPTFQKFIDHLSSGGPITEERLKPLMGIRDKITPLMGDSVALTNELMRWQWQKEKESEARQTAMREQMNSTLFTGLALNIALAIGMAVWLNFNTISRLRLIMSNAESIGKEPLKHVVSGNDEISTLDQVLHNASNSLLQSREKERELDAMKENFYAMVTHDLRSPLTSVGVAIQIVLDGAKGAISEKVKATLTLASESLERASIIINDFLDLRKLDAKSFDLKLEDTRIKTLVSESIKTVAPQAQNKNVTLMYDVPPLSLRADGASLSRVLINLLTNSVKFSASGDTIELGVIECDGMLKFEIRDQGPGIPDSYKEYVFASFKQLPDQQRYQGTGLGLAICKQLVEQHGGQIGVADNQPKGSIFWFTIPLANRIPTDPL